MLCFTRRCSAIAALIIAIGFYVLCTPPQLETDPSTGALVIGRHFPVLPIIVWINAVFGPFKKSLLSLEIDDLKQIAMKQEGLDDFGDIIDWDATLIFLKAIGTRNMYGRLVGKAATLKCLSIHLKLTNLLKEHPEILDEPIDRPIIITGTMRSGTTFLHQTLTHTYDHNTTIRSFSWTKATNPLESDTKQNKYITRIREELLLKALLGMNPLLTIFHEIDGADSIQEETPLLYWAFGGAFVWMSSTSNDTSFLRYVNNPQNQALKYRFLKRIMQVIQWTEGVRYRWILKSPDHLSSLPALFNAFPDLKLIVNWRESVLALKSMLTMQASMAATMGQPPAHPDFVFAYYCTLYRTLLHLNETTNLRMSRFDVEFQFLVENTFNAIELVAKFADLPWGVSEVASANKSIMKQQSRKRRKLFYNMSAFDLTEEHVAAIPAQCELIASSTTGVGIKTLMST